MGDLEDGKTFSDFLFANLEKYLYDASGKDMTILINEKLYMLKKKGIDFEVLK